MSVIRPLNEAKRTLPKRWFALDTETVGLYGKPIILCLINQYKEVILELREDNDGDVVQRFYEWILGNKRALNGVIIFAHNLEFDLSKIFGNIINNPKGKALFADSRLIMYSYTIEEDTKKRKLQFRDTFNLCPMSLSDIGEMLGYKKYHTPDKFKVTDSDTYIPINNEDVKYCVRDCEIVIEFVKKVSNIYSTFNVRMRSTYAANAKAIWQTAFLKENQYVREELDERFRDAYYGGRCEVFVSRHETSRLYYYDINSMYPYVMLMDMPDPSTFKEIHNYDPIYFITVLKKYEGMADVTVKCPSSLNIPILPYREGKKLLFPSGTFRSKWCFPEIRLAIEKGYEILEIHSIIVGNRMKSPFTEYVNFFTEMKIAATKTKDSPGTPVMREFAKRMLNSLYGKFAQRNPTGEKYVYVGDMSEEDIPDKAICCMIPGTDVMEYKNIDRIRARETVVAWAAYITSYSKVHLATFLDEDSYYCDTDSVFSRKELDPSWIHESEFGMMNLEDTAVEHYFADPKKYAYRSEDKFKVKIKGVPRNLFKARIKDVSDLDKPFILFVYDHPIKTKTSLRSGRPVYTMGIHPKLLTRHISPKRTFDEEGNSTPFVLTM